MNVIELIEMMAKIGGGIDNPPDDEKAIYLKYLNVAYFEIYRKTALINPYIIFEHEQINCVDGKASNTDHKPFTIRTVYKVSGNRKLKQLNVESLLDKDPGLTQSGSEPIGWFFESNSINTYPKFNGTIGIRYSKSPEYLNMNSGSNDIPFPEIYHSCLFDGACYYLFQDEGAFKDKLKMEESMSKWEKGKSDICNFLMSLSGNSNFSTFSVV